MRGAPARPRSESRVNSCKNFVSHRLAKQMFSDVFAGIGYRLRLDEKTKKGDDDEPKTEEVCPFLGSPVALENPLAHPTRPVIVHLGLLVVTSCPCLIQYRRGVHCV